METGKGTNLLRKKFQDFAHFLDKVWRFPVTFSDLETMPDIVAWECGAGGGGGIRAAKSGKNWKIARKRKKEEDK